MKKMLSQIMKLNSDQFLWALYQMPFRLYTKFRSYLYSWLLNAPGLHIGSGCFIRGTRFIFIGQNFSINDGVWLEAVENYGGQSFDPHISIGDQVSFSKNVHLGCINRIEIGNNVLFGSHIYVSDHNHGSYAGEHQSHPEEPPSKRILASGGPVIIEDNVWVGDNVTILGPARIGRGSVVAANSVVKGDIPAFVIVAGAPAKLIKKFDSNLSVWVRQK
jgi:acetyltransferase-like isoleucine patch superfamily enzyme